MWNPHMVDVYLQGFRNCSNVVDGSVAVDHRADWASVMEQVSSIGLHQEFLTMAFPCSRGTNEIAQYVIRNFDWDRRRVSFPLSPLLNDFQALCLSYELAVAEGATWSFELSELPQVIFYAMLLSEAERLGVLHRWTLHIIVSALTELRWSTFEAYVWPNGDQILEAQFWEEAEQEDDSSDAEGAASPSDDGKWQWRSTTCSPRPLPNDYRDLCPRFTLSDAERAALDFELPEMVHATFYGVLLNDVIELGIVSGPMAVDLKLTLDGLRSASFEESSDLRPKLLPLNFHDLYCNFDLLVAMQFAHIAYILEMVQAIFYVMVLNEAAELALSEQGRHKLHDDLDERLKEAQVPCLVEILANPQPPICPEETSRPRGAPPISSDDDD
ncbi:hypothetical protein Cgig2_010425 [Carnegiea gigantea]|uniref:Uncharacterized protein n=1 Tax=Carnegiea gigantea TaxID=171969 RepID=A0A9Q1K2W6_9CARY|nr:hypothetical protein Cgig2_010425 [Carnegiea gigantea]